MMSIVDFVRDGSRMAFYRDISEIMIKAGLYDKYYGQTLGTETKEKDKEKHFKKIVDLLEEQEFPENWFEYEFDRTDVENIVELLEVDAEQFELYVRAFDDRVEKDCDGETRKQLWYEEKKVVVEESESDSDGEEDSGQGAVEDSDDEEDIDDSPFCQKCRNLRYQYDILDSKEKWEKCVESFGGTTCKCEIKEDSDDEMEDIADDDDEMGEEGWHCCKCKQDFKESEVEHIDKVDAPVCLNCCVKYGLKNCDDDEDESES